MLIFTRVPMAGEWMVVSCKSFRLTYPALQRDRQSGRRAYPDAVISAEELGCFLWYTIRDMTRIEFFEYPFFHRTEQCRRPRR